MDISVKDRTSFGLKFYTHRRISDYCIKDFPSLHEFKRDLGLNVQIPDFDELGRPHKKFQNINSHFYFPETGKSYLDFSGQDNALAFYKRHITEMEKAKDANDIKGYLCQAGRALHFLHDMGVPHHTRRGSILTKLLEWRSHSKFEESVDINLRDIFRNYRVNTIVEQNYEDLFFKNVQASSMLELPTMKNKYKWIYIGEDSVNAIIDSTRLFFSKIAKDIEQMNTHSASTTITNKI